MDVTAELDAPCAPPALFAWVEDLTAYPAWLEIVARAELLADPEPADRPAWSVDLRARLGPLARSKRLRMVRTTHESPHLVVFERRERDDRSHSAWILRAEVTDNDGGSRLTMRLHYGGSLWGPMLERLLGDEIGQSQDRLLACIAAADPPPTPGG